MSDREALERVLATFGADRDRWPAAERLRFAGLLAENADARRMLAEARALDRLLDAAPSIAPARQEALAARIVAEAAGTPRSAISKVSAPVGPVVVLSGRAASSPTRGWSRAPGAFVRSRVAPSAALLAASLVAGLVIGWSTLGALLIDGTDATRVEVTSTADAGSAGDLQRLVFGEDDGDTSEEEFL